METNGDSVMVVGSGGREHALAWKLSRSPRVGRVFCLPGNPGTAREEKVENVPISPANIPAIVSFALENGVRLVVPGPESPLVNGLANACEAAGIPTFGPPSRAAMITEGSKCDAKAFMARHGIPTAPFRCFKPDEEIPASVYISNRELPIVVKDDQLASGKGVTIARTHREALIAARSLLFRGHRIVVERYLYGWELTFTCAVDGGRSVALAPARDRKFLGSLMTGGMGAASADEFVDEDLRRKIITRIVEPTLASLAAEDIYYRGFLYFGLMIVDGEPFLLEYNCRLGDPEAQVILPRLWCDFYLVLREMLAGRIPQLVWDPEPAACMVLASAGYPGPSRLGDRIAGHAHAERLAGVKVFHAGTAEKNGQLVTAGGRVLGVTAAAPTLALAERQALRACRRISWPGLRRLPGLGFTRTFAGAARS